MVAADPLPTVVPAFPLPGALLLPDGRLPLNIFEPRYVNLVTDALGAGRLMAMIQPRQPWPDPVPDDAELYPVGCLGRIVSFSETQQGGFLITLEGVSRFRRVAEEAPVRGYRRLCVDYDAYAGDRDPEALVLEARDRLTEAARAYFRGQGVELDWPALDKADDARLVATLAMICPLPPREKQALLECADGAERARLLVTLLDMAALQPPGADPGDGGATRH